MSSSNVAFTESLGYIIPDAPIFKAYNEFEEFIGYQAQFKSRDTIFKKDICSLLESVFKLIFSEMSFIGGINSFVTTAKACTTPIKHKYNDGSIFCSFDYTPNFAKGSHFLVCLSSNAAKGDVTVNVYAVLWYCADMSAEVYLVADLSSNKIYTKLRLLDTSGMGLIYSIPNAIMFSLGTLPHADTATLIEALCVHIPYSCASASDIKRLRSLLLRSQVAIGKDGCTLRRIILTTDGKYRTVPIHPKNLSKNIVNALLNGRLAMLHAERFPNFSQALLSGDPVPMAGFTQSFF